MIRSFVLLVSLLVTGCGDDVSPDAGDTGVLDSRIDSGRVDTGMRCDPPCNMTQACCGGDAGAVMCIRVVDDPMNCGGCGVVCAEGRGTSCELGACVCGRVEMGCLGTDRSWCCPARNPGGTAYCADFATDAEDCGDCNRVCTPDVSSACRGGECVCGDGDAPCGGTPDELCCESATGTFACTDTTSDSFHCGACGRPCMTGERCEMGSCVFGSSCGVACGDGEICCDGTCCDRISCARGEC